MKMFLEFALFFMLYVCFGTLLVILTITIEEIFSLVGWLTKRAVDWLTSTIKKLYSAIANH